jgi:hypothetical protein
MLEGNLHMANHPGKTQTQFPKTLPKKYEQRESRLKNLRHTKLVIKTEALLGVTFGWRLGR